MRDGGVNSRLHSRPLGWFTSSSALLSRWSSRAGQQIDAGETLRQWLVHRLQLLRRSGSSGQVDPSGCNVQAGDSGSQKRMPRCVQEAALCRDDAACQHPCEGRCLSGYSGGRSGRTTRGRRTGWSRSHPQAGLSQTEARTEGTDVLITLRCLGVAPTKECLGSARARSGTLLHLIGLEGRVQRERARATHPPGGCGHAIHAGLPEYGFSVAFATASASTSRVAIKYHPATSSAAA